MAVSKVDAANQIENQLPQANIAGNVNFRNIIINGDMSVAQRSTSETGITGSGFHTIDRYGTSINTAGTWTQSQSTDVPTGQGFSYSFKWDCTIADASLGASDSVNFQHKIEGQNLQYLNYGTSSAKSLTLSFWVKSNKTGTYTVEFQNHSPSTDRINCQNYTIDTADTWEKKTITIDGDTVSGKNFTNDNSLGLWCLWWLAAGSNFSSGTLQDTWGDEVTANRAVGNVNLADSTDNEWYITGVQLEAGTTASDFEFLPFAENHRLCKRYYEQSMQYGKRNFNEYGTGYVNKANASNANTLIESIEWEVEKRAAPTVTIYRIVNGVSGSLYIASTAGTVVGTPTYIGQKRMGYIGLASGRSDMYGFNYKAEAEL